MSEFMKALDGNTVGLNTPQVIGHFYNRSGAVTVPGQVYQCDHAMDSEATNSILGSALGAFSNVIDPVAAGAGLHKYKVMAIEAVADNALGQFLVSGVHEGGLYAASYTHATADGTVMGVSTDGELVAVAQFEVPCWMPTGDSATVGGVEVGPGIFDGIRGVAGVVGPQPDA